MKRIEATNDFVIKFANVNGSGSASANELFAKSFLRMGIPVSPRNIFPSNIQGLPTWYEIRVNKETGEWSSLSGLYLLKRDEDVAVYDFFTELDELVVKLGRALEAFDIHWFEEPVDARDHAAEAAGTPGHQGGSVFK